MATSDSLRMAVDWEVHNGARVHWWNGTEAVLIRNPAPMASGSHILHLLLTLITFGLWAPVWFCLAVFRGKPQVWGVGVDPAGVLYRFDPAKRQINGGKS